MLHEQILQLTWCYITISIQNAVFYFFGLLAIIWVTISFSVYLLMYEHIYQILNELSLKYEQTKHTMKTRVHKSFSSISLNSFSSILMRQ